MSKTAIREKFDWISGKWDEFWFADISAYPIALYRILLGFYLFLYMSSSLIHVPLFYSNEGVYSPFLIPDIAPPVWAAWLIYAITMFLAAAFTLGFRTRITAPLLLMFYSYHFLLNIAVKACSYDRLILFSLVLMCFGETDAVWSISACRKPQQDSEPKVAAWLTRLLGLHLAIFYFLTGMFKVLSPGWHNGDVLRGVMSGVYASNAGFWLLSWHLPHEVFDLMALLVICFELSCPFLFYVKRIQFTFSAGKSVYSIKIPYVQKLFFLCGLAFHTGIWLVMQLPQFMICPAGYVLFMDGEQVQSLVRAFLQAGRWLLVRTELWYERPRTQYIEQAPACNGRGLQN